MLSEDCFTPAIKEILSISVLLLGLILDFRLQSKFSARYQTKPCVGFPDFAVERPCELTVLLPVYNKAHYLLMSLGSIQRLEQGHDRFCVLCYDDYSTDNSVAMIESYHKSNPLMRLKLIRGEVNRGTLYARIKLVEAARSKFMVFLDPDDEFYGQGVADALQLIKGESNLDLVQFACREVYRNRTGLHGCWREPRVTERIDQVELMKLCVGGKIDVHLHRKIWRTKLFQRAVNAMPEWLREKRVLRTQDVLLYAYVLLNMTGKYQFLTTVGEIRHAGWPDNSQSMAYYRARGEKKEHCNFVRNWTVKLLGHGFHTC
jgi:glycosyltransferase involved in cell wall biosynthesis